MTRAGHADTVRVFTTGEKHLLRCEVFRGSSFDDGDFSSADLRDDRVSLRGCDFPWADLRGTVFRRCDLRSARFNRVRFGDNRVDESWFVRGLGIGPEQSAHIESGGGRFLEIVREPRPSQGLDAKAIGAKGRRSRGEQ